MPEPYSADTAEAVIARTPSALASLNAGTGSAARGASGMGSSYVELPTCPAPLFTHDLPADQNRQPVSTALPITRRSIRACTASAASLSGRRGQTRGLSFPCAARSSSNFGFAGGGFGL